MNKSEQIKLVLLDVDGVLTDGSLWIGPEGQEFKKFHVRDGLGIAMLKKQAIEVGIISGRHSLSLQHRAKELKIEILYQGVTDKLAVYQEVLKEYLFTESQTAYMGDDLPDIPILERVGLSAAPLDAAPEVCKIVHFHAPYPGGGGAVRALAEFILKSQQKWGI